MKKKKKLAHSTLLIVLMAIALTRFSFSQDPGINPDPEYWVDSLKIIPDPSHEKDVIKLIAYTKHRSGGCALKDYQVHITGNSILVNAQYESGVLTYICSSTDTMEIGLLNAGNYTLSLDHYASIRFTVLPSSRCRADFEWHELLCYVPCPTTIQFIDKSTDDAVSWFWDFGDNTIAEEQNPIHTYQKSGKYLASLTIITSTGCQNTHFDTVVVQHSGCQANFTSSELICILPCPNAIQFRDESIGDAVNWVWDFGDNTVSEEQNPIHTYRRSGKYLVSLTISTINGCSSTYSDTVVVSESSCKADFTWTEIDCEDEVVPCIKKYHFNDQSIGDVVRWYWHFGDGQSSNEQNPVHIYTNEGIYTVSLLILTNNGCSDSITKVLTAIDTVCKADFSWEEVFPNFDCKKKSTDCITPYYYAQFTDESEGDITNWQWDFGDGTSSEEQNPIHKYTFAGAYTVCLTIVGNNSNCYDKICKNIVIGDTVMEPCEANFTANQEGIPCITCEGCYCVNFLDQSSWNTVEWNWDFGDGGTSTEQNPIHGYHITSADQVFNVCLTIKTSDNCVDSICKLYDPQIDSIFSGIRKNCIYPEKLIIHPNPSDDFISIELSSDIKNQQYKLTIVDMFGRTVNIRELSSEETYNGTITYNVTYLNSGQYICIITANDMIYRGQFIVK